MIAIKFSSSKDAYGFAQEFQWRKFFSIEEDLCIVYELLAANIKSEKNHHSSSSDDSPRSPRDKEQPASQSEESVIINTSSKVIPVGIAFMTPKERVSLTKKL
jgi:hypothetical protein